MNPVIFSGGLNHVTYQNDEQIPNDLQLYYWDNSAGRYKPVGTLAQLKEMPESIGTTNVVGNLDGFITKLGTVYNVVLYYNSTPDIPIVNTNPNGYSFFWNLLSPSQSPAPERISIPILRSYVQVYEQYERYNQFTSQAKREVIAMIQAQLQRQGQGQGQEQGQEQEQAPAQEQAREPIQYPQNAEASVDSENRLKCDICDVNTKNVVFNCGHSICSVCNSQLQNRECPFCRQPITSTGPLFIGGNKNDYKQKYLKYKNKYLELKKLNI